MTAPNVLRPMLAGAIFAVALGAATAGMRWWSALVVIWVAFAAGALAWVLWQAPAEGVVDETEADTGPRRRPGGLR